MDDSLNERQRRERAYYSVYSRRYTAAPVDLDPVNPAVPARPWNPYWYSHRRLLDFYREGARRLLDFGCGWGDVAIRAAYAGFEVHGFDITPENIAVAKERAERAGLSRRTNFTVAAAEQLPYAPGTFDVVVGIDILHHVNVAAAIAACHRILRSGGHVLFKEPVRAPVFDALRNTRLLRTLFPTHVSFDQHITQDERKLDLDDIRAITAAFPGALLRPYRLLARAERIVSLGATWEKLDMMLLNHLSLLRPLAGFLVIEGQKNALH
jgi:2-polyprenyl-3-methyl-5-hydroxy-6-metoxy-1,4-benzoquinol methylase